MNIKSMTCYLADKHINNGRTKFAVSIHRIHTQQQARSTIARNGQTAWHV